MVRENNRWFLKFHELFLIRPWHGARWGQKKRRRRQSVSVVGLAGRRTVTSGLVHQLRVEWALANVVRELVSLRSSQTRQITEKLALRKSYPRLRKRTSSSRCWTASRRTKRLVKICEGSFAIIQDHLDLHSKAARVAKKKTRFPVHQLDFTQLASERGGCDLSSGTFSVRCTCSRRGNRTPCLVPKFSNVSTLTLIRRRSIGFDKSEKQVSCIVWQHCVSLLSDGITRICCRTDAGYDDVNILFPRRSYIPRRNHQYRPDRHSVRETWTHVETRIERVNKFRNHRLATIIESETDMMLDTCISLASWRRWRLKKLEATLQSCVSSYRSRYDNTEYILVCEISRLFPRKLKIARNRRSVKSDMTVPKVQHIEI